MTRPAWFWWKPIRITALVLLFGLLTAPGAATGLETQTLKVTATAYVSSKDPAQKKRSRTAWGETLAPGMKVIAVSDDLLEMGLTRGTKVRIRGLEGEYEVQDKMSPRWRKRIDIYMGEDLRAARRWGKRKVTIVWERVAAEQAETATPPAQATR